MATRGRVANVRTVIYCVPEIVEVIEIVWPRGARSKKHSHGKSYGFITVLEGSVYVIEKGDFAIYHKGDTFTENPDTIHAVGSVYGARTLHCYTPPITGTMTIYDDDELDFD